MRNKRQPIVIGKLVFASKAAVKRHVQAITKPGPRDLAGADDEFMRALFELHPSAAEKIGVGIRCIRVVRVPPYMTVGFELERFDGTTTDVSYLECINPTGPVDWFRSACRTAVVGQIQAAKNLVGGSSICPVTDEQITRGSCHIDHEPPWTFEAIVSAFLSSRELNVDSVEFVDGDGVVESKLADPVLESDFAAFHQIHARLRAVSARANLSVLRRQK